MKTYAADKICWDADSHIMEAPDFLSKHADPEYKDQFELTGGANGGEGFAKVYTDMVANNLKRINDKEATAKLEENVITSPKGWFAHGAIDKKERSKTLDLLGFKGQLVFSTFAASAFIHSKGLDLYYAGIRAHNRAMADFCGDDDRLLAVAYIPLLDPKRAHQELVEAIKLGCVAIHVPSDAPGGNSKGFSPAHVDLHDFWACLEESKIPLMLHVGGGKLLPKAYHNNGMPKAKDFLGGGENLRGKDFHTLNHSPENFLAAMTLDGVFDKFPDLKCGVIELGASWVPGFLRALDHARTFGRNEPIIRGLSLKPSDYIRRQVKFTPFSFEDIGWLIEQEGEDLFLFSSDYPHPEGGKAPIEKFDASLDSSNISQTARNKFYEHNFKEMMMIG
jgi:predicted TIM-barrel fold metal-dependent hydrolase